MQKHEVENATLFFGVGLPVAGWLAGVYTGNGNIGDTRGSMLDGAPIWKSWLNGAAISRAKKEPTEMPLTRRTTSPTSQPSVST